jgi:hypothetical protein
MKKILSPIIKFVIYAVLWLPLFMWAMGVLPANKESL